MCFLSRIFRRKPKCVIRDYGGVMHFEIESKRKFDSSIQKSRRPMKDPDRVRRLIAEFAREYGKYMRDLYDGRVNTAAIDRALQIAEQLTEMEPQRAVPWTNKCLALSALDRHEEALAANTHALEIDPSDPDKWALQANILMLLGRRREADQARKRANELK